MYGHRSIVRIKKNPSRERSINTCLILICYIFINLIFSDYWIYINSIVLIFILGFCCFYYCTSISKEEYTENNIIDIENLSSSNEDENYSLDSNTTPTIIAVPISPSGLNSNEYTVEVYANEI